MLKVGFYTLGCKVSLYETEAISEAFARAGYEIAPFSEVCDVYVINTCTVTAESDAKSRKYIRRAIRKNPEAVVIVIGCYSQRSPDEVAAIEGVSAVLGTADKMKCVEIASRLVNEKSAKCKVQSAKLAFSVGEEGPFAKQMVDEVASPFKQRSGRTVVNGVDNTGAVLCLSRSKTGGTEGDGEIASPSRRGGTEGDGEVLKTEIFVTPLEGAKFEPMCVENAPRTRAYVKIEDGCECKCTYCAISGARGPVRSKRPEDVISEVEGLYKSGTLEIVLTGIETGSYGADFDEKYDLADLMRELDSRHSCERIRLGSMAPELLSERFIEKIKDLKIMVPHFHISMQSGSDNVLRGMKRRYNRTMALKNIAAIREAMPDVMLTADLMVGFPGESDEDFSDTLRFVREARLLDAHVFAYSRREGTPAADFDCQIPEQIKKIRSQTLINECAAVRDEILSEVIGRGKPLSCILESCNKGIYTSHSDSYIEVRVEGERGLSGSLVSVQPLRHEGGVIYGKIL